MKSIHQITIPLTLILLQACTNQIYQETSGISKSIDNGMTAIACVYLGNITCPILVVIKGYSEGKEKAINTIERVESNKIIRESKKRKSWIF